MLGMEVWHRFLGEYNGRSLWMEAMVSVRELDLFTDAAGSVGFGAIFKRKWCAGRWHSSWEEAKLLGNLALLELFPIVLALELWGSEFSNKRVRFHCDNLGVVQAINKLSASSPPVVSFLRRLVLRCLELNCFICAVHLPGVDNTVADALSRLQWDRFRMLAPEAEQHGIPCPEYLWGIAFE